MDNPIQSIKIVDLHNIENVFFSASYTSCIVLTRANNILLQQRSDDCPRYPGCLAAFGGKIESGEIPIHGLIRELKEELGATVLPTDVISLGAVTEEYTNFQELIYAYFWHDKHGSITGCYEGRAKRYENCSATLAHPKVMDDVRWMLNQCIKLQLLS
jgi:8-oxo-dGTP diphosphatase